MSTSQPSFDRQPAQQFSGLIPSGQTLAGQLGRSLQMVAAARNRLLTRLRGPREVYAISVDQVWFAFAVILGLLIAGWLISGVHEPWLPPVDPLLVL